MRQVQRNSLPFLTLVPLVVLAACASGRPILETQPNPYLIATEELEASPYVSAYEAVETLRALRKGTGSDPMASQEIRLSACDPLNLVGVILPGPRIPALPTNQVLFRGGMPVGSSVESLRFDVERPHSAAIARPRR